jgi:hypothetical protein
MGRQSEEDEELVPLPVAQGAPAPDGPVGDRAGLDRSRRALGLGVLLAVLVGAGALAGIDGDSRPEASGTPPSTAARAPAPGDDEPAPDGWRRGSPGPLRHRDHAVVVWTGSELVIWGGDPDGDLGAAYDPAADRWRDIAPAPIPARCLGAGAWTGREVLVWGPACTVPSGRSGFETAAAAYDPVADRWRELMTGPVVGVPVAPSAWTGREWIVVGTIGPTGAFDPEAGRWRELKPVPRVVPANSMVAFWSGREVLVFGTEILEKGPAVAGAVYRHWAAALDPAANRWRNLPAPSLELAATAVWDGRRLIAWDMNLHAAALDPDDSAGWQRLPDVPVDFTDCSPEGARLGEVVFAEECGRGAIFRPWTGTWERVPHPKSLAEPPVWTGQDALFWVGSFAGSADGVWLYRPPTVAPGPDGRHRQPVPMGRG